MTLTGKRRQMIELSRQEWPYVHPLAVAERSEPFEPLVLDRKRNTEDLTGEPDEEWSNKTYCVTLRRRKDTVFGTKQGIIQIGVCSNDGTARHDWRDFQAIKNQLAGPECEAFELYPAESRLLDPSNYYTLWCFPGVRRINVGRNGERSVVDADRAVAPQRALAKPADAEVDDAEA